MDCVTISSLLPPRLIGTVSVYLREIMKIVTQTKQQASSRHSPFAFFVQSSMPNVRICRRHDKDVAVFKQKIVFMLI